jgi:hypothetical protein
MKKRKDIIIPEGLRGNFYLNLYRIVCFEFPFYIWKIFVIILSLMYIIRYFFSILVRYFFFIDELVRYLFKGMKTFFKELVWFFYFSLMYYPIYWYRKFRELKGLWYIIMQDIASEISFIEVSEMKNFYSLISWDEWDQYNISDILGEVDEEEPNLAWESDLNVRSEYRIGEEYELNYVRIGSWYVYLVNSSLGINILFYVNVIMDIIRFSFRRMMISRFIRRSYTI